MTGEEQADVRRKRFHHRSKSSIEDYTSPMHLDPIKDVGQTKESPKGGKQDKSRSWFKSKNPSQPYPEVASDLDVEDLKPSHRVVQGLYRDDDGGPSPRILVTSNSAARDAVKDFAKDFVAQMKAGDPDELLTMESQMRRHLHLAETSPPSVGLKFVAQAYIAHHFFSDFENASFGIRNPGERPWEVQDHMRRCFAQFQRYKTKSHTVSTLLDNEADELSFLSQFCMKKFRTIVPSSGAFFGGDCHHLLALDKGQHPDTPFYRSFLGAAVSVWLLQRLAFSFEQKIVPIVPTRGDAFQRRFMAPAVPGIGDSEYEENDGDLEIALTIFPGFRVSESIVESTVYVVEKPTLLPNISTSTSGPVVQTSVETSQKSLKPGVLQKIKSKFIRKKTLVKGTAMGENTAPVTEAPPSNEQVPSRRDFAPLLEESAPSTGKEAVLSEESAPSRGDAAALQEKPSPPTDDNDVDQNPTTVTSPLSLTVSSGRRHPPNVEATDSHAAPPSSVAASPGGAGDGRLYITRAQKLMMLQSPLRSPQLSSVD